MGMRETYERTLMRALVIAGDEIELASRLQVPRHSLVNWLRGEAPVPTEVFLRAVDIVVESNKQGMAYNRELLDTIRKRHRDA